MYTVEFEYPVKGQQLKIFATCKEIIDEEVNGLSLTFLDATDTRIHVSYEKEVFDDIEAEAICYLADLYYNRERLELDFVAH